jgi:hypothetical protein
MVNRLEKLIVVLASFTSLATIWLAVMSIRLQHPGYQENMWMGCFFAAQSIATLIAFAKPMSAYLRALTLPGSAILAYMGVSVFIAASRAKGDVEGYALVIGLAFIVQFALVAIALLFSPQQQRTRATA